MREHARVDSVRELAQFGERQLQLCRGTRQETGSPLGDSLHLLAGELEAHREREQALLSPVMQVALDAPPLVVGRLDHAGARGTELLGDSLPLGHDGSQAQGRDCGHGDEELRPEDIDRRRVRGERPGVVHRVPDGEPDHDHDREGGASRAEAKRGPDQSAEAEVRPWPFAARRDLARRRPGRGAARSPRRCAPSRPAASEATRRAPAAPPPGRPRSRRATTCARPSGVNPR